MTRRGRPRKLTPDQVERAAEMDTRMPTTIVARHFGVSYGCMVHALKKYHEGMIVKVQLSVYPKLRDRVLIYNQDESIFYQGPNTEDIDRFVGPNNFKCYARARMVGTEIELLGKVAEQDW